VCVCAQETYLSADDLRINLWHMEITDQSFNIVDIKPANMEELTEVSSLTSCYNIDHNRTYSSVAYSLPFDAHPYPTFHLILIRTDNLVKQLQFFLQRYILF